MRKYLVLLVIIFIIFASQLAGAATIDSDNLDFLSFDSFLFSDHDLRLPEDNFKDFSAEAQQELLNMASLYGDNELTLETEVSKKSSTNYGDIDFIYLNPLPRVELAADYGKKLEDMGIEKWTSIDVRYQLNNNTMLRAGYGVTTKETLNSPELELHNANQDSGTDLSRTLFNREEEQRGKLGISYQTSDKITLSADYINDKSEGNSAIFGVQYDDPSGKVKAIYQVDQKEDGNKQTTTGVQFAVPDMATFTASYKLLNPELIQMQLNREYVWDFGLDVNLSDISTFSIGYQLKNDDEDEDGEQNKEKSIKAGFQIDF